MLFSLQWSMSEIFHDTKRRKVLGAHVLDILPVPPTVGSPMSRYFLVTQLSGPSASFQVQIPGQAWV